MQQDHDRDREEPRISGLDRDELQTEYGPGAGAEGKRSPATLIFGAIVLVVVLAVAYFFTMGGDRSAPAPEPPLVVKPASEPVAIPAQTPDIPTTLSSTRSTTTQLTFPKMARRPCRVMPGAAVLSGVCRVTSSAV